jgi:hypothetical protein
VKVGPDHRLLAIFQVTDVAVVDEAEVYPVRADQGFALRPGCAGGQWQGIVETDDMAQRTGTPGWNRWKPATPVTNQVQGA